MAFFTKSEARRAAQRATGTRSAQDVLRDGRKSYREDDHFDVFLSHSINDAELVLGIKVLLEGQGLRVYVDWIEDKALERDHVTVQTAEVLRKRMKQSDSLLYLATDNASKSKWMPWELGYFDGFKPGGVGVWPVLDESDAPFEGQEYLALYPVMTKEDIPPAKEERNTRQVRLPKRHLAPHYMGHPKIWL